MVDKYGTGDDPACYPGTSVLKNLLNIEDEDILEEAEREISSITASEIEFSPPPYDLTYLQEIHRALFADIYSWAGSIRSIDISKRQTRFCSVNRVVPEAEKLFSHLSALNNFTELDREDLISNVAELYGDMNMIHPFRDGNGRAQRILFEHIVINTGFEISWNHVAREEWVNANIASVHCDYAPLQAIFDRCIGDEI